MHIVVVKTGPVFDGRAARLTQTACDEIERRVATIGASIIRSEQFKMYRKESSPPRDRMMNEATPDPPGWKIWDRNMIYGPWLEGVGGRNFPVTRFRGYAVYRRKFQEIDRRAGVIAQYTVREFIPGMNA